MNNLPSFNKFLNEGKNSKKEWIVSGVLDDMPAQLTVIAKTENGAKKKALKQHDDFEIFGASLAEGLISEAKGAKELGEQIATEYAKIATTIKSIKLVEDSKKKSMYKSVSKMVDAYEKKWDNIFDNYSVFEIATLEKEFRKRVKELRDDIKASNK